MGLLHELEEGYPEEVEKSVGRCIQSMRFLEHIDAKIQQHIDAAGDNDVAYVFMKGFGSAYPYLRVSRFMSHYEGISRIASS